MMERREGSDGGGSCGRLVGNRRRGLCLSWERNDGALKLIVADWHGNIVRHIFALRPRLHVTVVHLNSE